MSDVPSAQVEAPSSPMERAKRLVQITRRLNTIKAEDKALKDEAEGLRAQLLDDIENEQIPESFRCDGASVFTKHTVRFGPADGDHAGLSLVLEELGEIELLPSTVNHNRLSSFVREFLDPDESMPIADRLLSDNPKAIDPRLLAALKVMEEDDVSVNGAGVETKTQET